MSEEATNWLIPLSKSMLTPLKLKPRLISFGTQILAKMLGKDSSFAVGNTIHFLRAAQR